MKIEAAAVTDTGRVRTGNEDAVGCFPAVGLFVVCDGMGGHADGEVASRLAVESLRDSFLTDDSDTTVPRLPLRKGLAQRLWEWWRQRRQEGVPPPARIAAAVRRANARIYAEGLERAGRSDEPALGTTVVALYLPGEGDTAAWAHVGDSRLYRLREGKLRVLTADHTHYGQPYWGKAEIPLDVQHTNRLLQALGVAPEVSIDGGSDATRAGDVYLLCSDGLSGALSAAQLAERLGSRDDTGAIARELVRLANEAGGRDNISVVVVRLAAA